MTDRFTNQKPRIATQEECNGRWDGVPNGKRFRCHLCGHKFIVGDYWRWVYSPHAINFMVCEECDGNDVLDRWDIALEELRQRFWWALDYEI